LKKPKAAAGQEGDTTAVHSRWRRHEKAAKAAFSQPYWCGYASALG